MIPTWLSSLTSSPMTEMTTEPAPLNIYMSGDDSINGDYHVELDPIDEDNHVMLTTYRGDINASLHLVGQGNRTYIDASSCHGDIFLALVERESPVHITASARNGVVSLFVPHDFAGLLHVTMCSAAPDNLTWGEGLKRRADQIQDLTKGGDRFLTYRIDSLHGERGRDFADLCALNGEAIVDFVT